MNTIKNMTPFVNPEVFMRVAENRLGDAVRSKLGGQLSRAGAMARMLAHHAGETPAPAEREIVEALDLAEGMLQDVLEFWLTGLGGRTRAKRRQTDLRRICERVLDSIERRYPVHGFEFESDARVEAQWDPDSIAALVTRLVLNGVQHGPASGVVVLHLRGLEDRAIIEVRSAAPLAPDVPVHRLFEPFVCARPRKCDGETGLGLGLFLAEQIARAHRGHIEVESDARRGTTFRVALPSTDEF
jgi:signal transduction histidine kinase